MTKTEIIQAIKAEIERLKAKYRKDMYKSSHEGLASGYKIEAYNELLSFIDTLSEKPTLTWGDVQLLDTFILECAREEKEGKDWGESEEFYTEVLRRYNDFVERTIPEIVSKIHEYNENDREDTSRD